jgi:flagellar biosynthesis protein FlhA
MVGILQRLQTRSDLFFVVGMLLIMTILMVPLPSFMLDLSLVLSLLFSILIFVSVLFVEKTLDFSSFPTILLVSTLLRLALNVASTRLILSNGHQGPHAAGKMIEAFGKLVIGGNFVIGTIIFFILIIINFIVITKGSGRIAEVSARFSLDAMPGKQMAIDAELASGLITEEQAKKKRQELEEESNFFGSMDGAAKFVRGDAIAGVLITIINVLGGIIIGVAQKGLSATQASTTYTLLTVGDGLVTQIPALIVSTAAGLLVTKSGRHEKTDRVLIRQLGSNSNVLGLCAGLGFLLGCLPGLPMMPFFLISSLFGFSAFNAMKRRYKEKEHEIIKQQQAEGEKAATMEPAIQSKSGVLPIDPIRLEVGVGLINLIEGPQGNRITQYLKKLREDFSSEMGIVLPAVRIYDNLALPSNEYCIYIKETPVATWEISPHKLLVFNPKGPQEIIELTGELTNEPTAGIQGLWITPSMRSQATSMGYIVVEPINLMVTHLSEVIKDNIIDIFSYDSMKILLEGLQENYKQLLSDIVPNQLGFPLLQKILTNLISERISIRDLPTILESVAEACSFSKNVLTITEYVRQRLSRSISTDCCDENNVLNYVTLPSVTEKMIIDGLVSDGEVKNIQLSPQEISGFLATLTTALDTLLRKRGIKPVLLVNPLIRPYVRMIVERSRPSLRIISHNEIHPKVKLYNVGNLVEILTAF